MVPPLDNKYYILSEQGVTNLVYHYKPLFLLIDYFRVRFPTTDALKIIRDVLQLKADYMLYEDFGKYGYESKYVLGDINIMCSMQEHLGVLLELKGRGCRQMESSIQMIRQFIYISVVSPGGGRAFFDKSITVGFCRYAFCFMAATSFSRRFQQ